MTVEITQLPLGPLQTNCYLLTCQPTNATAVIDPSWNGRAIAQQVKKSGGHVTHILLTHTHFDHIGGLADLKTLTDAPIYVHAEAVPMLRLGARSAQRFGIQIDEAPEPDHLLQPGQQITVGEQILEVLFTPGHAPGHVSFYLAEHNLLFDGDVLFQGSIGRTDLPGGDYQLLMQSIDQQLLILPDETHVLSGHGPATTIGDERRTNPFLQR